MDSKNYNKEKRQAVKKRLRIFLDFHESGTLDTLALESHCSDEIIKLLDTGNVS